MATDCAGPDVADDPAGDQPGDLGDHHLCADGRVDDQRVALVVVGGLVQVGGQERAGPVGDRTVITPSIGMRWTCTSKIDRKMDTRGRGVGSRPSSGGGRRLRDQATSPSAGATTRPGAERSDPGGCAEEGRATRRSPARPTGRHALGRPVPARARAEQQPGAERGRGRAEDDRPAARMDRRDGRTDQLDQMGAGSCGRPLRGVSPALSPSGTLAIGDAPLSGTLRHKIRPDVRMAPR